MTQQPHLRVQELEDLVYRDSEAALAGAQTWLAEADPSVDVALRQRVRLVQAGARSRQGETETSGRIIREINAWALEHGEPWLRARSHRMLSGVFRRVGDPALALEHAVKAVDSLPEDVRPVVRADHLTILADALSIAGSYEQAQHRYAEAGTLADASGDPYMRLTVLNNLAYTHCLAGNGAAAVSTAEHLMAMAARHDYPLEVTDYDTVARAYTLVGRFDEAVRVLLPWVGEPVSDGHTNSDYLAVALLTLAEIYRMAGSLDNAQATLDRVRELAREYELTGVSTEVQREQAELYATRGRFQEAFESFKAFHDAVSKLRAAERETRARTLQAVYEAAEARRDSARFRELSVRDPLTGLSNRRYVDDQLAGLLLHATDSGTPVTLALLDLDHFKLVNDLRSHDVGDTVLREVARLLEHGIAHLQDAIAARLGGEEFLLVLPGMGVADAADVLEEVRRSVAERDWEPVTSGVPVTISIGSSTLPDDGADRKLLHHADERLYEAKRRGRNQVVGHETIASYLEPTARGHTLAQSRGAASVERASNHHQEDSREHVTAKTSRPP